MRFMFLLLGLYVGMNIYAANAAGSFEEYADRLRQESAAAKNSHTGAFSHPTNDNKVRKDISKAVPVKQPEINQAKKTETPIKKPDIKQPDKHNDMHNKPQRPHAEPDKTHQHSKPHNSDHRHKHHHSKPQVINNYGYTPTVTYVTIGNGLIYDANPHIYSANTYGCTLKGDLKYCTDSIGKPLTGRVIQNYTDSIAYETYKNGYLSGETSSYTPDGTLIQTTNYRKGQKNGKETVYFNNGSVHYIVNYSNGLINGEVRQYNISGITIGEMRYRKGHYTHRYCRYDTNNDLLRARIKANEKNELILCAEN